MAQEKKIDELAFGMLVKELTAFGELIRTNQDEKQTAMDDFDKERERFRTGKISKKALASSAKKVNKELSRLDRAIRQDIANTAKVANQIKLFTAKESPKTFRASLSGIKHI